VIANDELWIFVRWPACVSQAMSKIRFPKTKNGLLSLSEATKATNSLWI